MFKLDNGVFKAAHGHEGDVELKSGPRAVGIDVSVEGFLSGIPEHAYKFELDDTFMTDEGWKDPYRLYNVDNFKHSLNQTAALYGSVPFMLAQG